MKQHFSRFLASLLSVLIVMQCFCMTAFADGAVDVIIPAGSDAAVVNQILTEALLGEDSETREWEYYCNGVYNALISNDAWGSVQGFTSIKTVGTIITKKYTCNHPALADNDNGQYQVRVTGTTKEYTINKKAESDSSIQFNNNASAALVYTDNSELDVDATEQAIFNAVVASTEPEYLTADNVTIEYEATSTITTTAWMPLNGGTKNLVNYPAISSGVQKIRISWGGDEKYNGFSAETSVMMTDRAAVNLVLKADQNVALTYKDGAVNYDALKNAIFAAVFDAESSTPSNLLAADVTIEYYYQGRTSLDSKWAPLKGGTVELVNCAGMTVGNGQKIRVSFKGNDNYSDASAETTVNIKEERSYCTVVISGDKLNIKDKSVNDILDAIVTESTVALTSDNSSVEYYDKGGFAGYGAGWKKLESLSEGTFKIRVVFNGNDEYRPTNSNEEEIRFVTKEDAKISLNDAPYSVAIPYNEASEIDFNALKTAIFQAVVASVVPDNFTENNVTIEYYYKGISSVDSRWLPLEGQEIALGQRYPAISAGTHNIKFSWAGNDDYYGLEKEVTVTLSDRETAPYMLNDPIGQVKLTYNEDLSVNYDTLRTDIFNAVIASSEVLTADNVTITYYATAVTGAVGDLGKAWMPLEGGKKDALTYPAVSTGDQLIRIYWAGSSQYAPTTIEATVNVTDREALQFNLNDGPYEIGFVFNDQQGYDYDATAKAIIQAVVASTTPEVDAAALSVEYDASLTGISTNYKPLNNTDTLTKKFGEGSWNIRISWNGNQEYAGNSVTVSVTMTDSRIASAIILKEGVSFTYNKDVTAMKQAVFDNVIDWENSTLPARETLTIDDFTFTYNAQLSLLDGAGSDVADSIADKILGNENIQKAYVPFEGKSYEALGQTWGSYPQIGAGEQQIRVVYNGNAEYKPSAEADGTVTVNKASVKVSVKSASMYISEMQSGLSLVSTDPVDDFDMYILYAGITNNVTSGIYLELPARYTSNSTLLKVVDKVLEGLEYPTLTQMMQDGITVGELKELLNASEVIEAMEKLGIDTGSFGQIISVINKLPSIGNNIRIGFGVPNQAGIYTVAAITDNRNYNTGVGMGALVLKADKAQLVWNKNIGSKLTAAEAQNTDFGASLMINGIAVKDQSSVHVLYSGLTSKWKIYSSTTTPPTEPGRYTMTVVVLGGNYTASPVTRSFQITK